MLLVTGGAGYVGSHIVLALQEHGREVLIADDFSTGHRDLALADTEEADIRDTAAMAAVMERYGVDTVIHCAARSQVGESMRDPELYYHVNVAGTLSLLRAMRQSGVRRFVLSSTAAVYGTPETLPITEDIPRHPENVYGETKHFIESMLHRYAQAYGLQSIALRYFNAAGADPEARTGEHHVPESHLIPLVLDAAMGRRESITVFGDDYPTRDGTCIRDYIHVTDLADAHVAAVTRLQQLDTPGFGAFNLGSGNGYTVQEIITAAESVTQCAVPVHRGPRRAGDPPSLIASRHAAERELRWEPRRDTLEDIIGSAWRWHRKRFG
ncbi:MAG: UDP-glucose 4-epimerase GalE [Synergistales bacterium]|nr:UDP-glucose 4-epimerase GalE [Synergistales bacterium]